MPFNETLAKRIRKLLARRRNVSERKMFGGLAFMVNDYMCCGIVDQHLVVRVGPAKYEEALARPHTRVMDFTGRPMKGYIYVEPTGYQSEVELKEWIMAGVEFVSDLPPK